MTAGTSLAPAPPRTLRIDTPEQVELGFEIADLGSRFLALLVDGLILSATLLALGLLAVWVATRVELGAGLLGWGGFALGLLLFAVFWGYFTYFEAFHGGRTPGKRWVGIRVVHDGGYPLTLRGAAIRNLVRIVDAQPGMSWIVGGVAMMVHPRTRRLGDMAAGTLVVRDRGGLELSESELERLIRHREAPRLDDAVYRALEQLAARRAELAPEAREHLTNRLVEALGGMLKDRSDLPGDAGARLLALYREERERRGGQGPGVSLSSPLVGSLVRGQAPRWLEYRRLLRRAESRGLTSLSHDELERFAALYRSTAADLARARTYGAPAPVTFTLERWVGSGHNLLYRPGARTWTALAAWLRSGFPSRVRARRWYVAAAAACLFLPGLATYGAVRMEPSLARELLPQAIIARAETAAQRAVGGGRYVEVPEVFMPLFSSQIITNNVQVSFMAFAGGVLAGLGTIVLLAFNGLHLGAVVALFENEGADGMLWEFVAPHGVMELIAICIAGAAGLLLGSGLVAPGRMTRTAALASRAREAVSFLAGTTLLLVLAGLIEGFVSPAVIPVPVKLAIAGMAAGVVVAYLLLAGRTRSDDPGHATGRAPGPGTGPAAGEAVTVGPDT
ncbi:MAG: stage II sporulation protein M [Gemmatimonadota bacterium]